MKKIIILGFIFSVCFLTACKEESLKITADERVMIDTMSANKIGILRGEWDRECFAKQDSMVQFAIDSLTEATLHKIDQQLKPYHE